MAEVYYRLKSAGGDFTRVVGTSPLEVTGLTDGVLYEYAQGDDTLAEIMPGVAPSVATAPTISGARVGETPTANAATYNWSPVGTITPGTLLLDGTAFSGTLQAADEGKTLTYTGETATNALDSVTPADVTETVGAAIVVSDADAADYISRVETADGQVLEAATITALDTFFANLKTGGNFAALKASCIFAGARTVSGALEPLVSTMPTPTNLNIPTANYNRKTGLIGEPSVGRIETGHFFRDDPTDDRHRAVYVSELPTVESILIGMSNRSTGETTNELIWTTLTRCADMTSSNYTAAAGFIGTSRSISTSYTRRNNGADQTLSVNSIAASGATTYEVLLFNDEDGTGNYRGSNARISFYSAGTATDLAALDACVAQLMTELNAAIA